MGEAEDSRLPSAVPRMRRHPISGPSGPGNRKEEKSMKRRLASLLLAAAIILTLLPAQALAAGTAAPADAANPFQDVRQGSWYYDAVQYVRANGLFYGTSKTTFWPEGTMTRGMFVTVLGRMAGVNPEDYAGPSSFADVAETAYYAPYVAWAAKYGIPWDRGWKVLPRRLYRPPADGRVLCALF